MANVEVGTTPSITPEESALFRTALSLSYLPQTWSTHISGVHYAAVTEGASGADITVAHVISGTGSTASVAVVGNAITVTAGSNATATTVAAAVNASTPAAALVTASAMDTAKVRAATATALGSPVSAIGGRGTIPLFNSGDDLVIPDLQSLRWLKRDGTASDANIYMWEEHDTFGGELIISSPWRIALIPKGGCQMGANDPGRFARYWLMVSGNASDASPAVEYMPSGALGWQSSVWDSANKASVIYSQARQLDKTGSKTILEFFSNATMGGANGTGNLYTPTNGLVTGTKMAEFFDSGIWHPGLATEFSSLVAASDVYTQACSKYHTTQTGSITLADNATLKFSGQISGMRGVLYVTQPAAGSALTLTPLGGSALDLSTDLGATDRVSWEYDGIYFNFAVTKNVTRMVVVSDDDAIAFLTAGSITDAAQKAAVSNLVSDLKSTTLWAKAYAIYPFVGGTATAHALDLTGNYDGTFSGTPTHNANGITGNATDAIFDSGFIASSASPDPKDSICILVYGRGDGGSPVADPTASAYFFGATGSDSSRLGVLRSGSNVANSGPHANTISGALAAPTTFFGHFGQQRVSSAQYQLFSGSNSGGLTNNNSLSACDRSLAFLGRRHGAATWDLFTNANLAFGWISSRLTVDEYAEYRQIVDKFQAALGRNE